jgi:hypothetical protein
VYQLGAIPITDQNLPMEATEAMTRLQERERVFIAVLAFGVGLLAAAAFLRRA